MDAVLETIGGLGTVELVTDDDAGAPDSRRPVPVVVEHGPVSAVVGWLPDSVLGDVREALEPLAAAVPELPVPRGVDPPTRIERTRLARGFGPLVDTYGVPPYSDVDPTWFAGFAFVVMVGMMFGDLGHGLVLAAIGLAVRAGRPAVLARFRPVWPLLLLTGLSGAAFGLAYGEFFGPTGVVPALWLSPLEEPITLLVAAVIVGSSLLAVSYLLGSLNRWREGGLRRAMYAPAGIGGAAVFGGIALGVIGLATGPAALATAGWIVSGLGVVLIFAGATVEGGGGGAGIAQGVVESFDALLSVFTGAVSFARLAAFGLTHAALSLVVWQGTVGLSGAGPVGWVGAVLLFTVGTVAVLALEGLVAFVQALRLEYYELFSRVFTSEGRPFRPFSTVLDKEEP